MKKNLPITHMLLFQLQIFECGVISPGNFNCDDLPNSPSDTLPMIVPYFIPRIVLDTAIYHILHYRKAVDNTTLDEVTTMITNFNPNLTKFHPTLAVVITSIFDSYTIKVEKYITSWRYYFY